VSASDFPKPETVEAMRAAQDGWCCKYGSDGEELEWQYTLSPEKAAAVADRMVSDAGRALCERIAGELRDLAASLDYSAAGYVKEIADALDPEGDR
jgi:hypothetical protein